jgi:phytoene dehydrogenase-like protein
MFVGLYFPLARFPPEAASNCRSNFESVHQVPTVLRGLKYNKYNGLLQNIFHGSMSLDQLYFNRPTPQYCDNRSPIPGLYLCGSGAHPGTAAAAMQYLMQYQCSTHVM